MTKTESQIRNELKHIQGAFGTHMDPIDEEQFVKNRLAGVDAENRSICVSTLVFAAIGLLLGIALNVCLAKGIITIEPNVPVVVTAGRAAASILVTTLVTGLAGLAHGLVRQGRLF